jgi:hypothetical protein
MKKLKFWLLASLFAGAFALSACSSSDDPEPGPGPDPKPSPENGISEGTKVNPGSMKMSALTGFVFYPDGTPLPNVEVTSGSTGCITGPDGGFVLEKVSSVNSRTEVKFACQGYFEIVRTMPTKDGDVWQVTMNPTWNNDRIASITGKATQDISVNAGGMTVELQANGLKYAETGEPVNTYEWVTAQVLYLSPDDKDFATMMPGGDLAAVRSDKSQVQLVSYGMVNVSLTANGLKAQLADDKPATVTFPVPEKFKNDTPDEIPLWSFNEETGLWEEEGVATYDSQENVYRGQVKHFSWCNLDYPEKRATLKVNVKDEAGNPIPNQMVNVGGQSWTSTNVNGVAELFVPINTDFYVTVDSKEYCNYSPEVKVDVSKITTAGSTKTVDIVLPTMVHISGKVVNSGKGNNLSSLWIEYNGKNTRAVHTDGNGQFIINAPFDYKGAAKLVLLASDGSIQKFDINLDGKDHAYTINIKTDKATGGMITYIPVGGTAKSLVVSPIFATDFMGVEIVDDYMGVSSNSLSLEISNYSESKPSYSNASISYYGADANFYSKATNVTVSKNEYNNYSFKVSGNAQTETWNDGKPTYQNIGTFSGEFVAPFLGKGKTLKPITKKESFFPSFIPWIDSKKPTIGLQVTESPLYGTGVLLWYFDKNLGYDDYKAFKEQAQKALGTPVKFFDADNGGSTDDISVSYFYKDGKYIMVSYCPWREENPEDLEFLPDMSLWCLRENHAARIQVHAMEGMISAPDDLIIIHGQ